MSMNLPPEIIDAILSYLPDTRDLWAAALLNKHWNSCVTPLIYQHLDISETEGSIRRQHEDNTGSLSRVIFFARTLAENPLLGSYVQSIRHANVEANIFAIRTKSIARYQLCLPDICTYLQAAVEKSSLVNVKWLELDSPHTKVANILLKALLPTLKKLRISSSFIKHYDFPPAPQLEELNLEFELDRYSKTPTSNEGKPNEAWAERFRKFIEEDEMMHKRLNCFIKTCQNLKVFRIFKTKELHTILDSSVTLPSLKTLDIGPIQNRVSDLALFCLASFLKSNPGVERLAIGFMRDRPDEVRLTVSEESRKNIKELVTYFEELPNGYLELIEKFTNLESFKLVYDTYTGAFSHQELLDLIKTLGKAKIKRLQLPMPSHISGWTLESNRLEIARSALMEFGQAFTEHLPQVEELVISQPGKFWLPLNYWHDAIRYHPSLRALYANYNLTFPELYGPHSEVSSSEFPQDYLELLAVLPKLDKLVFAPSKGLPGKTEISFPGKMSGESLAETITADPLWDWKKEMTDPFFEQIFKNRAIGIPARHVNSFSPH
ncbi:hypothetical protein RUND412_006267 [Rhizina undulata]